MAKAAQVGTQGLQIYATQGEMAPENLTPVLIAEKKRIIADNGLQVAALCGDIGGFMLAERNQSQVDRSKRILDLALEFNTSKAWSGKAVIAIEMVDLSGVMM